QTLMAQPVDPKTFENRGDLFPTGAEQVAAGANPGDFYYSISKQGILSYQTGAGGDLMQYVWFDRAGKQQQPVSGPVRRGNSVALSMDGKWLATERIASGAVTVDLWFTDLEHGNRESRFTFDASRNVRPVFSPDASRVAFASGRTGIGNLYLRASN